MSSQSSVDPPDQPPTASPSESAVPVETVQTEEVENRKRRFNFEGWDYSEQREMIIRILTSRARRLRVLAFSSLMFAIAAIALALYILFAADQIVRSAFRATESRKMPEAVTPTPAATASPVR